MSSYGFLPRDIWYHLFRTQPQVCKAMSIVNKQLRNLVLDNAEEWVRYTIPYLAGMLTCVSTRKTLRYAGIPVYKKFMKQYLIRKTVLPDDSDVGLECYKHWKYFPLEWQIRIHTILVTCIYRTQSIREERLLIALARYTLDIYPPYLAHTVADHLAKVIVPLYPPHTILYRACLVLTVNGISGVLSMRRYLGERRKYLVYNTWLLSPYTSGTRDAFHTHIIPLPNNRRLKWSYCNNNLCTILTEDLESYKQHGIDTSPAGKFFLGTIEAMYSWLDERTIIKD